MPKLLVSNLQLERVSEAYPVIRHLAGIDLEQWDDFTASSFVWAAECYRAGRG